MTETYDYGYIPNKNDNLKFSEFNLDPKSFDFLEPFQRDWTIIRDEHQKFLVSDKIDFALVQQIMKPKSQTITAKTITQDTYTVIGLLFNGISLIDLIKKYDITWENIAREKVIDLIETINTQFFPKTIAIIKEAVQRSQHRVRTVYYGTYKPGLDLKLHTNNNPHTYRAYLGLKVPKGNIGIKVCGGLYQFIEGDFLVLDHAYPHCPHNFTDEYRTALIIDFLRPNQPYETMLSLEKKVVEERLKDNLYSYGVFGKDDAVSDEDFIKYGLENQLHWKNKSGFTGE